MLPFAAVFLMLISGIVCAVSIEGQDTSADPAPLNAAITETLSFNPTDAGAAAEKINLAAGDVVCSYSSSERMLVFSRSVNVTMTSAVADMDFLLFNDTADQGIRVDEGVIVTIFYENANIYSANFGTIKKVSGNFMISGSGELNVYATGSDSISGIICDGTLNIARAGNTRIEGKGSGVYLNGLSPGLTIERTVVSIKGLSAYGVKLDTKVSVKFDVCDADIRGPSGALSRRCSSTTTAFVTVFGTHDFNGGDLLDIDVGDMCDYKCVKVESSIPYGLDIGKVAIYAVIGAAAIGITTLIVVVVLVKRKKSIVTIPPASALSAYESKVPGESARYEPPAPAQSPKDGSSVEIVTQSAAGGESFALSVDGRVYGYIGPQKAFLTVPGGMHEVAVTSNTADRKPVFRQNMIIRPGMQLTVEKKLGGYKVDLK